MKKLLLSTIILGSIFLGACTNVSNKKTDNTVSTTDKTENKTIETTATSTKKSEDNTNNLIMDNVFGLENENKIKITDWKVIPANSEYNPDDRAMIAFYFTLDKTESSKKVNRVRDFFFDFKLHQGDIKLDDFSGNAVPNEVFAPNPISKAENAGLSTIYSKIGYYLSDNSTPVTVTTTFAENKEVFDITNTDHMVSKIEGSKEQGLKPNPVEIISIYSSLEVGHVDETLLSIRKENPDGAIDIAIETANGYVRSTFDGDYLTFENMSVDGESLGGAIKYNYVTKKVE